MSARCSVGLHDFRRVEDVDHSACGTCFHFFQGIYPTGHCVHSFKVCRRCGKAVGYGSHGKLTVVPDGCKKQIASMKEGP